MGIYANLTYIIGKVLSIFLESVYFIRFLRNLFGLPKHYRQNLIKVMREQRLDKM